MHKKSPKKFRQKLLGDFKLIFLCFNRIEHMDSNLPEIAN